MDTELAQVHLSNMYYTVASFPGGAKEAWAPLEFRNICTRLQFAPKMLKNIDFPHDVEGWIRFCTPYELTEFLRKIQNVVKIVIYLEL